MLIEINQGRFWGFSAQKSYPTLWHFCGHVTPVTWILMVPHESPWVVDSFRHWHFSICSKNMGVIVNLIKGYNCQKTFFVTISKIAIFPNFLNLYPSIQMTITPMFFEQIEKFQCLKVSTTQGLSYGTIRIHVARGTCPQTCPKVCQLFWSKTPQKWPWLISMSIVPKNTFM